MATKRSDNDTDCLSYSICVDPRRGIPWEHLGRRAAAALTDKLFVALLNQGPTVVDLTHEVLAAHEFGHAEWDRRVDRHEYRARITRVQTQRVVMTVFDDDEWLTRPRASKPIPLLDGSGVFDATPAPSPSVASRVFSWLRREWDATAGIGR